MYIFLTLEFTFKNLSVDNECKCKNIIFGKCSRLSRSCRNQPYLVKGP